MELEGRVAFITGGGRGLGRATAIALADRGAKVVIVARTLREVEETALLIRQQYGVGRSMAVRADLTNERDVMDAFDKVRRRWEGVDILINNAGDPGATRPITNLTVSDWHRAIDANLTSAFLCTREAMRDMTRHRWGRIVNVSSDSAAAAVPGMSPYSVAKAGVEHLTRLAASEGASMGVIAVALRPGIIDTRWQEEMRNRGPDAMPPELRAAFSAYKQRGLLVSPDVPARMIAFLCINASSNLNGRVLDASEMEALLVK